MLLTVATGCLTDRSTGSTAVSPASGSRTMLLKKPENAVLFGEGAWPPPGAEVEVRYERAEACDRPDAGGAAG